MADQPVMASNNKGRLPFLEQFARPWRLLLPPSDTRAPPQRIFKPANGLPAILVTRLVSCSIAPMNKQKQCRFQQDDRKRRRSEDDSAIRHPEAEMARCGAIQFGMETRSAGYRSSARGTRAAPCKEIDQNAGLRSFVSKQEHRHDHPHEEKRIQEQSLDTP